MPVNILMPALSPTMTEGTLTKWHIKVGDQVASGDVYCSFAVDEHIHFAANSELGGAARPYCAKAGGS